MTNPASVAGEAPADIIDALRGMKVGPVRDGMCAASGKIGPPAIRALMRMEAELLLADADSHPSDDSLRTPEQRRHDALLEVLRRSANALGIAT